MRNFSLKALGALLLAAGLVVAGVAAPAASAPMTITSTVNTFSTGQPTGDFTVTGTQTVASQNVDMLDIFVKNSTPEGWAFKNTCPSTFDSDLSLCGVTSVSFAADGVNFSDVTTGAQAKSFTYAPNSIYRIYVKLASPAAGDVGAKYRVQYNNAFTAGTAGTYTMTFGLGLTSGSYMPDSGTLSFTSSASLSTVTFDPNGGTGSLSSQSASGSTNLSQNNGSITRSGYTFNGWNTAANGSGTAYADGATYVFSSSTTLYAQWTADSGGSSASANLTINASTGQLVAGSSVAVAASGLQSNAPYEVVVRSTPQTIGSGNAVSGAVNTSVTLPAGLEAGWHSLTFSSTAADGSAMTSVAYFKVSASGTLLATSTTIPAELANTGVDSTSAILLLAGGLSLALVGAEMFMIARRKRSN